jgi:hypothetical protein
MHNDRQPDAGFTLIETVISTLLTLVIISAAMGAFTQAIRLTDTSRLASEVNQGLQVGVSLMVRDFVQVGQGIPTGGVPLPNGGGATPVLRPGPAGAGLTFPAGSTLPALLPGASLGPSVLGISTDMVTILSADPTLWLNQYPLESIHGSGNNFRVDPRTNITGPNGIREGDLILFSNPLGNALRMVTATPSDELVLMTPSDPIGLNQMAADEGTLASLQTGPGEYPPTTATRVVMVTYYIDVTTDPSLPRLVRQVNNGPRLAVALAVENLQFTYDLVDGTTNPTNVETPGADNSPHQIRKVNLFLAGRSLDLMPNPRKFFRNSMATQVTLRSLSFIDRYN